MSTHTEHADNPKAEATKYTITLVALLILTAVVGMRVELLAQVKEVFQR